MRQVNCIFPLRVRISGQLADADLDSLSDAVASAVQSRLRFAREILASHLHAEIGPTLLNQPTLAFKGKYLSRDSQSRIEQIVRQAIERGSTSGNLPGAAPYFLLAQYKPGTSQPPGMPATSPSKKAAPKKAARPRLLTAPGQEKVFWDALRNTVLSLDRTRSADERAEAVRLLVELVDMDKARAILRAALDIPFSQSGVRFNILNELLPIAKNNDVVWDLILYGTGQQNDSVAEGKFFEWFKQAGGRATVDFLEQKLSGKDQDSQHKAAKVVLYLLEKQFETEAARLATNFARLRKMAAKHNLWTGGALGEESLRKLIADEVEILIRLTTELGLIIQASPYEDSYRDTDVAAVVSFHKELHSRLDALPRLDLAAMEALDVSMAQAIQAATAVRPRFHTFNENAKLMRQFLGNATAESDEIKALFQLRHDYVVVITNVLKDDNFAVSMRGVDIYFVDFGKKVAAIKGPRISKRFYEVSELFRKAKEIPAGGPVGDWATFYRIQDELELENKRIEENFRSSLDIVVGPQNTPIPKYPVALSQAVRAETQIGIFGIHVGMYTLYAIALRMQVDLIASDIGSRGFQTEKGKALSDIRTEIAGYYQRNQLKAFIDRAEALQDALKQIGDDIKRQAKKDLGWHLLITAVAAVLSFGAAAIVRVALLGETLALVRTAEAASAIVLLTEAGAFTAGQLAGEKLAFGKPVTLGGAAESFLSNVAFFGVFKVLGRLTAPLGRGKTLLAFVAPHLANIAALTTISALLTRLQTGQWPQDIGLFLIGNLANYVIIAGIGAAARAVTKPAIEARAQAMGDALVRVNDALLARYRLAIESGTLTEPDFEAMRKQKLDLHAQGRELAKFLHQEGFMGEEQFQAAVEALDAMDGVAKSARFVAPKLLLAARSGQGVIHALPSPGDVPGLIRLGDSDVYRFDPSHPPGDLSATLARYEANGYAIVRQRNGAITVRTLANETAFVLEPGPIVPALMALPPVPQQAAPSAPQAATQSMLSVRAMGYVTPDVYAAVAADLQRINPRLEPTLAAEFGEPVAAEALGLFVEQRGNLTTRWPIDAVRGVANMLQPERGIALNTVRRLFQARSSAALADLFQKYQQIAGLPGANFLVDSVLAPSRSATLIDTYDAIRHARLQLPAGMTPKAVRGLLRWAEDAKNLAEVVQKLSAIRLDRRLARLEADSPTQDPAVRPPSHVEEVLRHQAEDIRPGLNLLHGKVADVMQALDAFAQRHGGSFSEPAVRAKFEVEINKYRDLVANFQSGGNVERNLVGARNEIDGVLFLLERGQTIIALGPATINVNPTAYPLARGRLVNWPTDIKVQLDSASRKVNGRFVAVETTTHKVSLPESLKFLDPESGLPPGDIDYNSLDVNGNQNERKFVQFIKTRAAAYFARDLAKAFGHATAEVPELVFRGETTAPARRALIALGFTVVD